MKTSHEMERKYACIALGIAAVSAVLTAPASAHDALATDAQAKPYTMAVIINDAHGKKVQSGDYEIALSNRGVLMAAAGDKDLAKQNFLAAIELDTKLTSVVEGNLERLEREKGAPEA